MEEPARQALAAFQQLPYQRADQKRGLGQMLGAEANSRWQRRNASCVVPAQVIEHYGTNRPGFGSAAMDADDGGETSVRKAQEILKRLRKRDLYKFVEEFLVPQEVLAHGRWVHHWVAHVAALKMLQVLTLTCLDSTQLRSSE